MKLGDLVLVNFPACEQPQIGIYVRDDTYATDLDSEGWTVITRGYVLWDGAEYSTPLDQLELICPPEDHRSAHQQERFSQWRPEKINESR